MQKWQCRWSPTLGELEGTHQEIWGTDDYTDQERPTVFFGLYGLPDFYALWRHKGEKHILWAGTDIIHFDNGYWLEEGGDLCLYPAKKVLAKWINKYCVSWCENKTEKILLELNGITAKVCPSFLGDINKFPISEKKTDKKRYYTSVSGDNFKQYGWTKIPKLAVESPSTEFHLYGNKKRFLALPMKNVIEHSRVPKEQMNEEIKSMTGCIRLLDFDGFSEIVCKAILMGQEVISSIDYPFLHAENPREELLKVLNKYPWNQK